MTKKAIFLLAVTICGQSLHAETFYKYVGIQGAYGKESKSPGLGIHVAEDWGCHFRTNLSFNYFFKHNGITHLGGDIEWNYLLNLGKHWRLGPLTGVGAYLSGIELHWDITKPRKGQWDMGHKPDAKYSDLHRDYMDGKITKEEFLHRYRDPNNYRPELPINNRSHKYE
ncbi:MAG: HNH/ENDO VII family nuclease [Prevotella sp.]|nr:HNH/ENDO VII family nuclease [Prevotella sp.]